MKTFKQDSKIIDISNSKLIRFEGVFWTGSQKFNCVLQKIV